jgi:hypothetical protein
MPTVAAMVWLSAAKLSASGLAGAADARRIWTAHTQGLSLNPGRSRRAAGAQVRRRRRSATRRPASSR